MKSKFYAGKKLGKAASKELLATKTEKSKVKK